MYEWMQLSYTSCLMSLKDEEQRHQAISKLAVGYPKVILMICETAIWESASLLCDILYVLYLWSCADSDVSTEAVIQLKKFLQDS